MNCKKKTVAFLCSLAIVSSIGLSVAAENNVPPTTGPALTTTDPGETLTQEDIETTMASEEFNFFISNVFLYPERLGLTETQVENAYIGNPFMVGDYNSSQGMLKNPSFQYFPVYTQDGDMIAILSMYKEDGNVYYSIGQDYAPEISDILEANPEGIALYFTEDDGIFAVSQNDSHVISEGTSPVTMLSEGDVSFEEASFGENVLTVENDTMLMSLEVPSTYITHDPNSSAGDSWYVTGFPEMKQYRDSCWATCIAAMARFELPGTYGSLTASDVSKRAGVTYGEKITSSINDMDKKTLEVLNTYFLSDKLPYIPTYVGSALHDFSKEQWDSIYNVIQNNDVALMQMRRRIEGTYSDVYHDAVLVGYADTGSTYFNIWVMDPAVGRTYAYGCNEGNWFKFHSLANRDWIYTWCGSYYFRYK